MIPFRSLALILLVCALTVSGRSREEVVSISGNRSVTIEVPDGMNFRAGERNEVISAEISDPAQSISLVLRFLDESPARFDTPEKQKTLLGEWTRDDIEQSVEQQLNFKSLNARRGSGLYLVLTDGNLIDQVPPPGQFLKLTRGINVQSDVAIVFTLYSQSETSQAYQTAMRLVRTGLK